MSYNNILCYSILIDIAIFAEPGLLFGDPAEEPALRRNLLSDCLIWRSESFSSQGSSFPESVFCCSETPLRLTGTFFRRSGVNGL